MWPPPRLQSGSGVDVFEVRDITVGTFSNNGWLYDLWMVDHKFGLILVYIASSIPFSAVMLRGAVRAGEHVERAGTDLGAVKE